MPISTGSSAATPVKKRICEPARPRRICQPYQRFFAALGSSSSGALYGAVAR
jgi:hypothetical protein